MIFEDHSDLEGRHAFLSASKYHWINYDVDKLISTYKKHLATLQGTELHEWAAKTISLGRKQPDSKDTLNLYINDAIGYRMTTEQPLYYSDNCFGTADAICFRDGYLRIHDLKTGEVPASMHQLEIYAALFCLEYGVKPKDIKIELRIYQSKEILKYKPKTKDIQKIMAQIVLFDKEIEKLNDKI